MKTFLFALILATTLSAAESTTVPLGKLRLLDGRTLNNVIVRSYDAHASKVLLLADGKAMLIPIDLIPAPHAERILAESKRTAPDLVQSTPVPTPSAPTSSPPPDSAQLPPTTTSPAPPSSVPVPTPFTPSAPSSVPSPASPAPAPAPAATTATTARQAHRAAAVAHARRYYKYEYRTGSNAIAVTDSDIAVDETVPVPGWSGRFRTTGKVYLEVYDSVGGGSFRRGTSRFEILTEETPGEEIKVVDFTRK